MSAIHTKALDASGAEALVPQTQAVSMEGQKEAELAVDGTFIVIAGKYGTGRLVVTDETNSESAVFSLHQASGVPVTAKSYGSAAINATKDNASTINVYVESGEVVVQNKLAASADINVKAYI